MTKRLTECVHVLRLKILKIRRRDANNELDTSTPTNKLPCNEAMSLLFTKLDIVFHFTNDSSQVGTFQYFRSYGPAIFLQIVLVDIKTQRSTSILQFNVNV